MTYLPWHDPENWAKPGKLAKEPLLWLWIVIREIQDRLEAVHPGTKVTFDLPGGYEGSYKKRCIIKEILEELQRQKILEVDEIHYKNNTYGIQDPPWYAVLIVKKEAPEKLIDKVIKIRGGP